MSIQNLQKHGLAGREYNRKSGFSFLSDPFLDSSNSQEAEAQQDGLIHIRIQQRNGRKTLTTVQGIDEKFDQHKLVKVFKKEFACNGCIVEHAEYGQVIQLQGDQRNDVCAFLTEVGICKPDQLKVHGF